MKKIIIVLLVLILTSALTFTSAFAGGDKVRGEKGKGSVNQEPQNPDGDCEPKAEQPRNGWDDPDDPDDFDDFDELL